MLFGIIIGSIGEEIGWRSFFQPFLETKYSKNISSIIVGVVWGLWHIGINVFLNKIIITKYAKQGPSCGNVIVSKLIFKIF